MSLDGWQSVTNDYSKTIITLSTAFLAFTVTFWQDLLPAAIQEDWFGLLILIWICLFLAIASALYSAPMLVRFLLHGTHRTSMMRAANISYFSFGLAAVFLLILGIVTAFTEPKFDDARALALARSVLEGTEADAPTDWQFVSMHSLEGARSVLFTDKANRRSATLVVRRLDGCVTVSMRKLLNAPGHSTQVGLQATDFATKC